MRIQIGYFIIQEIIQEYSFLPQSIIPLYSMFDSVVLNKISRVSDTYYGTNT